MKAFLWIDSGFYANGVIVAIAETLEEARAKVIADNEKNVRDGYPQYLKDLDHWNTVTRIESWKSCPKLPDPRQPEPVEKLVEWAVSGLRPLLDREPTYVGDLPFSFYQREVS